MVGIKNLNYVDVSRSGNCKRNLKKRDLGPKMNELLDITKTITDFRNFLVAAWPYVDNLIDSHDWDNDGYFIDEWLQVNWEFLVERELLNNKGFLIPFRRFLDANRITNISVIANYEVIAKKKNEDISLENKNKLPFDKDLRLFGFCTIIDEGFGLYPPFDIVKLIDDSTEKIYRIPFADLSFYLKKRPPEILKTPL